MNLHLPSIAALGLVAACGGGGETLPPHNHVAAVHSEGGAVRLADWDELSTLSEELGDDLPDGDSAIIRQSQHMGVIEVLTPSPLRSRGYFVTGNHAPYDALGGTAAYEGVAATLEIHDPVDAVDHWDRIAMSAESGRLVADFDAGTVSGRFDEWRRTSGDPAVPAPGRPALDVSVTLEPAPITRTGFRGSISVSGTAPDLAGTWDVSYAGSFYGPDADDVAGVVRGTRQVGTGSAEQVIGWFTTAQQTYIDLNGE